MPSSSVSPPSQTHDFQNNPRRTRIHRHQFAFTGLRLAIRCLHMPLLPLPLPLLHFSPFFFLFFFFLLRLKIVSCISVCFCFAGYFFVCLLRWSGREMFERERQRSSGGEREKMGEKNKVGPATVINWDPQKNWVRIWIWLGFKNKWKDELKFAIGPT